ncbi:PQQ-dependent sugar dehydrogenase [Halospeciosus flavus]|uniref:PQQ-dependent sugar dehydrogenase n=1 Tax=Halospeciosus flavus TaxID=3032283 RepID=A0ABD5Z5A6_9EURY|nr:PQQ-dependent sugar dehydrogenase [Halospeciosus flavus]
MSSRRSFLRAVGLAGVGGLAGLAGCQTPDGQSTTRTSADVHAVAAERLASGFVSPVDVRAPAGTDALYVADQPGRVYNVDPEGGQAVALDLRDAVVDVSGYDERGLLGLAFHPDFPDDPRAYVRYSAPRRSGTPTNYSHTFVLAEFRVEGGAFVRDSERTLLEIPEPQSNHNGGDLAFGPEGHLYVAIGDGGGGGDAGTGHVTDWYERVPGGNGQNVEANLLGSVLRLDVDSRTDGAPYGIPADNPLVGRAGLDEHYAWGFRNPWRLSVDSAFGLLVADVGQSRYEEVDQVVRGGNYGWNVREGTHCYGVDGGCPSETPDGDPLRPPVVEYPHSGPEPSGIAVVGGYVYRGDALDGLRERYVFADWRAEGSLFVADPTADTQSDRWPVSAVPVAGEFAPYVLSFGEDRAGELLVCTSQNARVTGTSGALCRLVPG